MALSAKMAHTVKMTQNVKMAKFVKNVSENDSEIFEA